MWVAPPKGAYSAAKAAGPSERTLRQSHILSPPPKEAALALVKKFLSSRGVRLAGIAPVARFQGAPSEHHTGRATIRSGIDYGKDPGKDR